MTALELRQRYCDFFVRKKHALIEGRSLLPENDPTVLFITAGMQPLVPYILGQRHPLGTRLVNFQKCLRTGDIEEVGDQTHLTFFEMLGNWSLGDYFKEEAISLSYQFLSSPEGLGIDPQRIWVSVFAGEGDIPRDDESAMLWEKEGIPRERIAFLGMSDNWWGPAGQTGPCGPDTEIFLALHDQACSSECRPSCPCGRFVEIWNNVFMQYNKNEKGEYQILERFCVDTGMGLERTAALLSGFSSVYETELFKPLLDQLSSQGPLPYGVDQDYDRSLRLMVDHFRASLFLLSEGVLPSKMGQGYVLRRLMRRALYHARKKSFSVHALAHLVPLALKVYQDLYPELKEKEAFLSTEWIAEEERYARTIVKGEQEFYKILQRLRLEGQGKLSGIDLFHLYDTYGFPCELSVELAREEGLEADEKGFAEEFEKHQTNSRSGSEKIFKGGLQDHGELSLRLHTATHLLHKALQCILGDHVRQKGSNITAERLRFDFSHPQKMSPEEIKKVEDLVNEQIHRELDVHHTEMTLDEARASGAMALFTQKYEERVTVYRIGDFSLEVCGGPHVANTRELGSFKILKEEASSAGVRRIKAILF